MCASKCKREKKREGRKPITYLFVCTFIWLFGYLPVCLAIYILCILCCWTVRCFDDKQNVALCCVNVLDRTIRIYILYIVYMV